MKWIESKGLLPTTDTDATRNKINSNQDQSVIHDMPQQEAKHVNNL